MGSTISAIREIEKAYNTWENYLKQTAPKCTAQPMQIIAFKYALKDNEKAAKRLIIKLMNEL